MSTKVSNGLDLLGQRAINLGSPSSGTDAANKDYVDNVARGLDWKTSVRAATTGAQTLASDFENGDVIDGVTLATGDRILIKNQAAGAANGIYTVNASGAPTRAVDADANAEVTSGLTVTVEEGTVNGNTAWMLTTDGAIVVGTTALVWSQLGGGTSYLGGNGLTLTGSTFAVGAGTGIVVNADDVAIDPNVVVRKFAANIGDGAATQITVTHNLGTEDVDVQVRYAAGTKEAVIVDWRPTSSNAIRVDFAVAPASAEFRVIVQA